MDWKTNPISLCEKLVLYIGQNPKVSLDALEARAVKHGIAMSVFDQAVAHLHKLKGVKRTASSYGVVKYELQEAKKPAGIMSHVTWCSEHYPYTDMYTHDEHGVFIMAFPELAFDHLFLKPDELLAYKAQSKGRVFIKKKSYEYNTRR